MGIACVGASNVRVGASITAVGASSGSALLIRAVNDITIDGGRLDHQPGGAFQSRIDFYPSATGAVSTRVKLLDLDVGTRFHVQSTGQPMTGFYRLQGSGNPNTYNQGAGGNGLMAPKGSEYVDIDNGQAYRKTSAWNVGNNWAPF